MKIINKENLQKKVTLYLDYKQYSKFMKDIVPLIKVAEYKSNPKNLKYTIVLNSVRVPHMPCRGIVSRVVDKDGRISHAGFFDWDNILESILLDDARYLCSLIKSPIWIFKSSERKDCNGQIYGNYMGIALIKKSLYEWTEINKLLSTDISHSLVANSYRYKAYVLRMSKKGNLKPRPEFKYVIDNGKNIFPGEISNAHKEFLEAYYPEIKAINKKYKFKLDKHKGRDLVLTSYKTSSE